MPTGRPIEKFIPTRYPPTLSSFVMAMASIDLANISNALERNAAIRDLVESHVLVSVQNRATRGRCCIFCNIVSEKHRIVKQSM